MSANFDSSTPLAYTGLNTQVNPPTISVNRAPLPTDWQSFNPGDLWRDTSVTPPITYLLQSVQNNVAIWEPLTANSPQLFTITTTSGTPPSNIVHPDANGNINFVEGSGITIIGNVPSSNSLTISSTGGSGAVSSVQGTTGFITPTTPQTGAVVLTIDPTYVGQTSITTLGTITSGTWHGAIIDGAHGGTGIANTGLTINLSGGVGGYVLKSDGAGNGTWGPNTSGSAPPAGVVTSTGAAFTNVASTTAGQILQSTATAATPAFSTATYPATTTINQILYSSATNTIGQITTANNGVLITSAAGVPSISSTLPTAVQGNITATGTVTSGTWNGTVIDGAHGGTGVANTGLTINLGSAVNNYVMTSDASGNGTWKPAPSATAGITSVKRKVFTTSGTYTPASDTSGMLYCDIEIVGGGGGCYGGSAGGNTSVGTLITAFGGGAGGNYPGSGPGIGGTGGAGGDYRVAGGDGGWPVAVRVGTTFGGYGGSTYFGGAAAYPSGVTTYGVGGSGINLGSNYGGGGGEYARGIFTAAQIGTSKAVTIGAGGAAGGGSAGNPGVVIITAYCS